MPTKNNQELMRILIQHGIEGLELASMNQCQMFLKAPYLSDICTGNRKYIDTRYWAGKDTCQTKYQWPRTETPMTYKWNMWRINLTNALSLGCQDSLGNPLGNWEFNQGQKDGLYLEKEGNHLWTRQKGKWHIHTKA